MTCQNCVRHVEEALRALPGVRTVSVDLAAGSASIDARTPLSREALAAALDEAGYTLA